MLNGVRFGFASNLSKFIAAILIIAVIFATLYLNAGDLPAIVFLSSIDNLASILFIILFSLIFFFAFAGPLVLWSKASGAIYAAINKRLKEIKLPKIFGRVCLCYSSAVFWILIYVLLTLIYWVSSTALSFGLALEFDSTSGWVVFCSFALILLYRLVDEKIGDKPVGRNPVKIVLVETRLKDILLAVFLLMFIQAMLKNGLPALDFKQPYNSVLLLVVPFIDLIVIEMRKKMK